ncbi:MAG: hypothetical protein GXP14_05140 [Gammaproteobacteria bacterium]|nr:hypothetical protein [Gammaproteobacteria bacterium]
MFAFLSKAFGFSSLPDEHIQFKPRQINLSGEIISFSIPENFSTDMPAEDMIESVSLTDKNLFKEYQEFLFIQRWWDFKDKGFFAKEQGSVMMSIYVKQAPENSEYDILNPLEFVGTIIRGFNEKSRKEILENDNGEPSFLYPDFYQAYTIRTINSLHWFRYPIESASAPARRFDVSYAIPITPQHYVVIEFMITLNHSVSMREFFNEHGRPHMDAIMDTFNIQFSPESKLPSINSQPIDLDKLIDEKFNADEEPVEIDEELFNSIQPKK